MNKVAHWSVRCIALALVIASAFGCGWAASAFSMANSQSQAGAANAISQFSVPAGFRLVMVERELSNQQFGVGDRVDVMIPHEGRLIPLITGALILREDWQTVALIVRNEEVALIVRAKSKKIPLSYRAAVGTPSRRE